MTTNRTQTVRRPTHRDAGILRPPTVVPAGWLAAATVVVVLVGGALLRHSAVDLGIVQSLNTVHVGLLGAFTAAIYTVFSPVEAILLTAAATALVWMVRRDVRPAAAFAAVIAGTWLPSAVVKLFVDRSRPDAALLPHPFTPAQIDASYPSGHSVFVTAAAIAVVLLFADSRFATVARVLAPLGVLVVLLSLLVDGVHYPTDVLASVLWALGVAPFVRAVWLRGIAPRIPFLR